MKKAKIIILDDLGFLWLILYYIFDEATQTAYFLDIYGKKERASLSEEEKNAIKSFIKNFKKWIDNKEADSDDQINNFTIFKSLSRIYQWW